MTTRGPALLKIVMPSWYCFEEKKLCFYGRPFIVDDIYPLLLCVILLYVYHTLMIYVGVLQN